MTEKELLYAFFEIRQSIFFYMHAFIIGTAGVVAFIFSNKKKLDKYGHGIKSAMAIGFMFFLLLNGSGLCWNYLLLEECRRDLVSQSSQYGDYFIMKLAGQNYRHFLNIIPIVHTVACGFVLSLLFPRLKTMSMKIISKNKIISD